MKILTTNHPIIVNGVKESKPSDYLTADGVDYDIDVKSSKNPIIVNGKDISNPTWYLGADGLMTDVVSTKNPIIVDGKDISNPTWYLSADGERMSKKRANNVSKRIAKIQREIANAQGRIDKINARVSASGKPMGKVDQNVVNSLTKMIQRKQTTLEGLMAMQSSSADGDDFYNADATPPVVPSGSQPTPNQVADAKKKGLFWDKAKGTWVFLKEGGILDWVGNILGVGTPPAFQPTGGGTATSGGISTGGGTTTGGTTINDNNQKGLSKTQKTLVYVGGALLVGFVIYELVKKGNKGKNK